MITDITTYGMLIDGELRGSRSGEYLETINPATGEVFARFPKGEAIDVDDAVSAAGKAFPAWWALPPLQRSALLERLADSIVEHAPELTMLDVVDNGSPVREMRNDAFTAAAQVRYFAGLVLEQRGDTIPTGHDRLNYTLRHPFGVVGRIIPFNHPLMFACGKIAAPLIAGNTVILKPSEHTSISALRLGELANEILPPWRTEHRHRSRCRCRRCTRHASTRASPGIHRISGDRSVDTGSSDDARRKNGDARARREEPDRGVPRCGS